MKDIDLEALKPLASKYIWWKTPDPDGAVSMPLLAQAAHELQVRDRLI